MHTETSFLWLHLDPSRAEHSRRVLLPSCTEGSINLVSRQNIDISNIQILFHNVIFFKSSQKMSSLFDTRDPKYPQCMQIHYGMNICMQVCHKLHRKRIIVLLVSIWKPIKGQYRLLFYICNLKNSWSSYILERTEYLLQLKIKSFVSNSFINLLLESSRI
jgi:hypothetical protein